MQGFHYILILVLISSCTRSTKPVPFPADNTEFPTPVTISLQLSEPRKIEWKVSNTESAKPAGVRKVNFDKLPSKPFYPNGFFPLDASAKEVKFDFNQLPDTLIDFKNIEAKPLRFKTSLIDPPRIVKSGLPKLKRDASTGIFEFGEDQGFPGYIVTSMMQDSHGMFWIATDKGLCRFNGEYLEIYSFIEATFTGSIAEVSAMIEDRKGRIWIYTTIGIYVFDHTTGVVDKFVGSGNVRTNGCDMLMDSNGLLWVGTIRDGIFIIDPEKENVRQVAQLKKDDKGNAEQLVEDAEGNIWVGAESGISIVDYETGMVRALDNKNGLPSNQVTGLFKDSKNQIWISTLGSGISIVQSTNGSILTMGTETGIRHDVNNFIQAYDQKIWMASAAGVYIFDPSNHTIKFLDASKGLSDDFVINLMNDNEDQVWIATNLGLNLIDTKGIMPNFLTAADGLSGPDVWSFLVDRQHRLWIGSRQGVDIFYPDKNRIIHVDEELQLGKGRGPSFQFHNLKDGTYLIVSPGLGCAIFDPEKETITTITKEQGLKNTFANSSMVDIQGRIWTGSFGKRGIEIIDLEKGTFTLLTNENGLIGDIVWEIKQDNRGMIWAATDKGINLINPVDNTISYLMENGKISERNGAAILNDNAGRVWLGTRSGILIVDHEKGLLTTIAAENGLINPAVYTLYENQGRIYAGTGNGLTVFIPKSKGNSSSDSEWDYDLKSYGKEQGFIFTDFNSGSAISYLDKLWFGIETQALTVIDIPTEDSTHNVTHISGISISDKLHNFYTNQSIIKKHPALDTLYSAQKDTFFTKSNLPKDKGWLQENNIRWDSLSGYFNLPVNLKIPHEQNYLSFQFTGSHSTNRDKVRYRYILEGYDDVWSGISDKAFSENYRDLPAGRYTFKVTSCGFNADWSQPAQFSFTILPHWTNTWWAWILYLGGFALVVGSIVQYRSKMLKRENLILEEKVKLRTVQLNKSIDDLKSTQSQLIQSEKMASLGELTAGIAHEIQNPLNFVNNFSEVNSELIAEMKEELSKGNINEAKNIANDIDENEKKIIFHGKRADGIVKGMLQHSRSSSGVKELTDINVLADEYLRLAYHGLRAKDKSFNSSMKTDFDESIGKINAVPQDLGRVILNLITNAFYAVTDKKKKIGGDFEPTVTVSTKKVNGKVEIRVKDNGNGIPQKILDKIFQPFFTTKPTGQGTGLGLSMSYDIITKSHEGEIKVETKEGEGSEFIIVLPQ